MNKLPNDLMKMIDESMPLACDIVQLLRNKASPKAALMALGFANAITSLMVAGTRDELKEAKVLIEATAMTLVGQLPEVVAAYERERLTRDPDATA